MTLNSTGLFVFRAAVVVLLGFIAVTLHEIRAKMPPTVGEFIDAATPEHRQKLNLARPRIVVEGSVDISGPGPIEISGTVDVGNSPSVSIDEPLDVRIVSGTANRR